MEDRSHAQKSFLQLHDGTKFQIPLPLHFKLYTHTHIIFSNQRIFSALSDFKNIINNHIFYSPNTSLTRIKNYPEKGKDLKGTIWEEHSEEFNMVWFMTKKLEVHKPVLFGTINFKFSSQSIHSPQCGVPIPYTSLHCIKNWEPTVTMAKIITTLEALRLSWNSSYRRKRSQDFNPILSC